MKILGSTVQGYIAELSETEVAWVQGYRNIYSNNYRGPDAGDEINIEQFVSTSAFVRELDSERLENISNYLSESLARVNDARTTVQALTLFETLKEDYEN